MINWSSSGQFKNNVMFFLSYIHFFYVLEPPCGLFNTHLVLPLNLRFAYHFEWCENCVKYGEFPKSRCTLCKVDKWKDIAYLLLLTMATSRFCTINPDLFCYICGTYCSLKTSLPISENIIGWYEKYFKIPLKHQTKPWAPHKVCKTCYTTLYRWAKGSNRHLKFRRPMIVISV